jgi:hypothetical protein
MADRNKIHRKEGEGERVKANSQYSLGNPGLGEQLLPKVSYYYDQTYSIN